MKAKFKIGDRVKRKKNSDHLGDHLPDMDLVLTVIDIGEGPQLCTMLEFKEVPKYWNQDYFDLHSNFVSKEQKKENANIWDKMAE